MPIASSSLSKLRLYKIVLSLLIESTQSTRSQIGLLKLFIQYVTIIKHCLIMHNFFVILSVLFCALRNLPFRSAIRSPKGPLPASGYYLLLQEKPEALTLPPQQEVEKEKGGERKRRVRRRRRRKRKRARNVTKGTWRTKKGKNKNRAFQNHPKRTANKTEYSRNLK